jgi:BASS family bile acid:Na+ symporter
MKTTYIEIFQVLVAIIVPLAAYAAGLRAPPGEVFWLWKRPGLLARSLVEVLVLIPLATILLLLALHVPPPARGGILIAILAIGIGPIAAQKRTGTGYEISLTLTLLVLSIAFMPAAVAIINKVFGTAVPLGAGQVAKVVLTRAVVPMLLGILTAHLAPRFTARIGRWAGRFINIGTLLLLVMLIPIVARPALALGVTGWLTCALVAAVAIGLGHLLGRAGFARPARCWPPSAPCVFPALALLLASAIPNGRSMIPAVMVYVVVSALLVTIYSLLLARRQRHRDAPTSERLAPAPG